LYITWKDANKCVLQGIEICIYTYIYTRIYIYMHITCVCIHVCIHVYNACILHVCVSTYGVATVSRIDTIIGLFCRIASLL